MSSKTEIANIALTNLGATNITDFDEDSSNARKIRSVYNNLCSAILQEHPWNFAIERDILAPESTAPRFGYSYTFKQPIGCLRVLNAYSSSDEVVEVKHKLEGRNILCNTNVLYIKYVKSIEDESLFTPLFVQALAARIAYELCFPITNSYNVQGQMLQLYNAKLQIARSMDALEGTPDEIDEEGPGTWVGAHN